MSPLHHALAGAALVAALVLAPAAGASASTRAPMYVDAGSAGVSDATRDLTLDRLADVGTRALRVTLVWGAVAPDAGARTRPAFNATDPGAYDWGGYGRLIDAAHARGWRVLVTFSAPAPRWATASGDGVTRPNAAMFGAFTTAAGRRFGAAVDAWGLWNEPNHPRFLKPQYDAHRRPVAPALYRALHQAGVRGLEAAAQSKDTMLGGETAPGGDRRTSIPPLQFLRAVYCHGCAKLRIDGWAHHPYSNRRGPAYVPPDRDNVTIGVMSRLERALDALGHRATPIWITEYGVQSAPDTTLGVPLATQALFRSWSERIVRGDPRIVADAQYLLVDDAALSGFQSGLFTAAGRAKPSFDEFRLPLAARRDSARTVSLWGLVRPSVGTPTRVELLARDPGAAASSVVATRPTDASGIWTAHAAYRAGRAFRVRWTAPNGATYAGPPMRAYG
jgi:hypothetical protein